MSLESEFELLCHNFFDLPQKDKTPDKLLNFFYKLIQSNQKIQITDQIRYFIPLLASHGDGTFQKLLDPCIDGLSPMHYVPDLMLSNSLTITSPVVSSRSTRSLKNPRTARNARSARSEKNCRNAQTARAPRPKISDLNPGVELAVTSRVPKDALLPFSKKPTTKLNFKPQLPPLKDTQDAIMGKLYIRDNPNFFPGRNIIPKTLDINIMPMKYPPHMMGNNYDAFSSTAVTSLEEKGNATVNSLPQFVLDKNNDFMVRQIFRIRMFYTSKFFYTWHEMLREKRFRTLVNAIDESDEIAKPLFYDLLQKIRFDLLNLTENMDIFPPTFDDAINEARFEELQENSNKAILYMEEVNIKNAQDTEACLAEFFRQIRSYNLNMSLGFEELNSMSILPQKFENVTSDLKWRFQSMVRDKQRKDLLDHERVVAFHRQNYLGRYFSTVRGVYDGCLVMQCQKCLIRFLDRFSTTFPFDTLKRRGYRIFGRFHVDEGCLVCPSYVEFQKWASSVVADIKHAFLLPNKILNSDVVYDVDPEYDCPHENPMISVERFKYHQVLMENAYAEIKHAFDFFYEKIIEPKEFMKTLKGKVEIANQFDDFRDSDELQKIIDMLLEAEKQLLQYPKNFYHKIPEKEEIIDFILELRPAINSGLDYLHEAMDGLKNRIIHGLNTILFNEIQEKWASATWSKNIKRGDVRYIERRLHLFSIVSNSLVTAWKDSANGLKASFDTLISIYRGLNDKCPQYTHIEYLQHFNTTAEKIGLNGVTFSEDQEYQEEEEVHEEQEVHEEEEEIEEVVKPVKKKREKVKLTFDDQFVQTMTEEEEMEEFRKWEELMRQKTRQKYKK